MADMVISGVTISGGFSISKPPPVIDYSVIYGSGSYSTVTTDSVLDMGSGAYTVEAWFNTTSPIGQQTIVSFLTGLKITVLPASSLLRVWGNAGGTYENSSTVTINIGEWYHVAWVRESTSLGKLYLNGVLILTVTSGVIVSSTPTGTDVLIGLYGDGFNNPFVGYISNLRIVKGTSVYTSNFTPSTSALPATQGANQYGNPSAAIVSGTSLLTCKSSTIVDTSGNSLTITNTGTPTVSNNNPFSSFPIQYLIVAGGGGGGQNYGGGGGAGGLLTGTISYLGNTTITIGGGGATSAAGTSSSALGISTTGGGRGGQYTGSQVPQNGGSGGGGGSQASGTQTGGTGVSSPRRQGYDGGDGTVSGGNQTAGGGGAGAVGETATNASTKGSNGGVGLTSSISGTATYYGGGGGGFGFTSGGGGGSGGLGGGGTGSGYPSTLSTAGNVNTGGGGGGGSEDNYTPGNFPAGIGKAGGSGIVIIRYADTFVDITNISGGLTYSGPVNSGGYKTYTFTAGTGTVTF